MPEMNTECQPAQEQVDIIERYDREQKTRSFDGKMMARLLYWACIIISLYHFVTSYVGAPATLKHRSLHVGMMLFLSFVLYPVSGRSGRKKLPVYDVVLSLLSLCVPLYVWIDYPNIIARAGIINTMDMIIGTILVILVMDASRRISGWPLTLLATVFVLYGLFGKNIPGMFAHRGYDWESLVNQFFISTDGIYGTSVGVAASYIFLFILFGEVMNRCGM